MTTTTKQFGVGPAKDLFYPNVLTPTLELSAGAVQDAFRRTFDELYRINPPAGTRTASSVLGTTGFIDSFVINLNNNLVILKNEQWTASATSVAWNEHQLTYNGKTYTIAAGSSTNKYIYWALSQANNYQNAATFPTLNEVAADGSVASALIAVYAASESKLYPFWSAKMATAFIATALIEDAAITTAKIQDLSVSTAKIADLAVTNAKINDLQVDKLTTGTLTATVTITGTLQTSASNPKVILDSTNGLRGIDSSGNVLAQITTAGALTLKTANSGSRVELTSANGLRIYNSLGTLTTYADTNGKVNTTEEFAQAITGQTDTLLLRDSTSTSTLSISNSSFVFSGSAVQINTLTNQHVVFSNNSILTGSSSLKWDGSFLIAPAIKLTNAASYIYFGNNTISSIAASTTQIDFNANSALQLSVISSASGGIQLPANKYLYFNGSTTGGIIGGSATSGDCFISSKETFAWIDPGTSTTNSSIYVLYNNVLTQVKFYDDGLGHKLLYV